MKLKITQIKSEIGQKPKQKRTLIALGIHRMNQTVIKEDCPSNLGMINKVSHLVKVVEVKKRDAK